MAKALFGHLDGTETAILDQNRILKKRVEALEAQLLALKARNDRLAAELASDRLLTVAELDAQPAGV